MRDLVGIMFNLDNVKTHKDDWAFDAPIQLLYQPEITNVDVINQSIEMILGTVPGTRLFNLNFGSYFSIRVFQNMTPAFLQDLVEDTVSSIEKWEDRIYIIKDDVLLRANPATSTVELSIPYVIRNIGIKSEFSKIIKK